MASIIFSRGRNDLSQIGTTTYLFMFFFSFQVVISGEYNYSDPKVQDEVEALTKSLENTSYISNSLYTESWLRTFVDYVSRNNDYLNVTIDNEEEFIQNLKEVSTIWNKLDNLNYMISGVLRSPIRLQRFVPPRLWTDF